MDHFVTHLHLLGLHLHIRLFRSVVSIARLPQAHPRRLAAPPPDHALSPGTAHVRLARHKRRTSATSVIASVCQLLRKGRTFSQGWSVPVDGVDCNDEDERDAEKNGRGILEMAFAADIGEEGRCRDS